MSAWEVVGLVSLRMRYFLFLLAIASMSGQDIDLGLDYQTNAIVQLEQAPGGAIWGVSGSSIDRLPTVAGVFAVRSVDNGATWTTHMVTEDWWQWGADLVAIDKNRAYVLTLRADIEDTIRLFETTDAGATWSLIDPTTFGMREVYALHFFDNQNAVAFGTMGRKVSRMWGASVSTDGGLTWTTGTPVVQHRNEKLALRNGRATTANNTSFAVGMSSGRIFEISKSNASISVTPLPTPYSLAAISIDSSGSVVVLQQLSESEMSASKKLANGSWQSIELATGVAKIRGLKRLVTGEFVTIPWQHQGVGVQFLSDDLSAVAGSIQASGSSIVQTSPSTFVVGSELLSGKGLTRVER